MMSLLAPAVLAGLLAVAIPILVHLVQRERRRVVPFPSLMFLAKIPAETVRRRALRHWLLLGLRIAAIVALVLAFARPYVPGATVAAAGGRDVVVLLDVSASLQYGDRWSRAADAARRAIRSLRPGDRGTLVLFDSEVEVGPRATSDTSALLAALDRAAPSAAATRLGPALRAAAGLLEASSQARREVVLISDLQRTAWHADDVRLPAGMTLTVVPVSDAAAPNAAVTGVVFERQPAARGERVTAAVRVVNRSERPLEGRTLTLEADGHEVGRTTVTVAAGAAATFPMPTFPLGTAPVRVVARLDPDALPVDDVFHAVVSPADRLPVLVIEAANPLPDASLYLARALAVASRPAFEVSVVAVTRVTAAQIASAAVIVLNDSPPPAGAAGRALESRVRAGGGLLAVLGDRATWPDGSPDLLPGRLGAVVDRAGTRGGTLGFVEYSHPVFELFGQPRSGDLTAGRIFRYRTLASPSAVLARFDDGGVALAERQMDDGRVLAWTSTFDTYWNDLALKPVFVPLVLQAVTHLGRVEPQPDAYPVGSLIDPSRVAGGADMARTFVVQSPSGARTPGDASRTGAGFKLAEPGFYTFGAEGGRVEEALTVAVNVPADESDLTPLDPAVLAAAAGPRSGAPATGTVTLTDADAEHRQSWWWFLLVGGVVLLAAETLVAQRLPPLNR